MGSGLRPQDHESLFSARGLRAELHPWSADPDKVGAALAALIDRLARLERSVAGLACGTDACPCGDPTLCGTVDDPDAVAVRVQNYRDRIDSFANGTAE